MYYELISVIVPVYKVEDYLDACIQSIVEQTYKNLEIILVDDGSPDSCPQKCDEWAKKDSRIKVIHQKNGGAALARNTGLDFATGDYIGFVDSDDYISPTMYEELFNALQNTDKKMASCLAFRIMGDKISLTKVKKSENISLDVRGATEASFYKKIYNAVWCNLYKKSVFNNIRFPVGEVNEDYPILIPTIMASGGIVLVNKALYYYRKRINSVTSEQSFSSHIAEVLLKNFSLIEEQLIQYNLNCKKSFGFFLARNALTMALIMEKKYKYLDNSQKKLLKIYKKIMRKNAKYFMFSSLVSIKNKALYFMVLTKTLRMSYKLLKKPI